MKENKAGLSAWQLTMMALGTVIGGSFFLGSAVAVNAAGPSILLAFVFGGVLVYFILFALSEMTVADPDSGSFRAFASRAFGPGAGFVTGWVYWTGMVLAMSSEATAASILTARFFPGISVPLLGGSIIAAVTLVNLLGAKRLGSLESGLAAVKVAAVIFFILLALALIFGLMPGSAAVGTGALQGETFFAGGLGGLAGSMLIVMFTYAGFEVIGLAASETGEPRKTVPRAIRRTVLLLVGLYIASMAVLLPLIPTNLLSADVSPIVASLSRHGVGWAGFAMNLVLLTAILSTMLAAMFGIGRMMRSLVEEGMAPRFLLDKTDVPYRGILFSGFSMLLALALGLLFPSAYLFLVSSGGFAILFTYVVIMATHIRFRRKNGCPPDGKCQLWGFPYTSLFVLISLVAAIVSMPFVPGQGSGLLAGCAILAFFILCYAAVQFLRSRRRGVSGTHGAKQRGLLRYGSEFSKELSDKNDKSKK
ncbi:amino acid permease [Papillibacter cinnamivorans]|uniref:Amino acid transporter, AAT family n=1 Tax=Papillibacter cinnamivorans DSM 12816 TaxID=1122930 RepID=A0A1W2C4V7_9FIRM|nr:amino acid permease [Papillibacter cinnamivorans]SMC79912.1 amino acid transporter, AAT family [Papillibacter cinnamivorans DSM 12816]